MGTCKTCKHWDPPPEWYPADKYGECKNTPIDPKPGVAVYMEVCICDQCYGYKLRTLSEFGCVHHEPKP